MPIKKYFLFLSLFTAYGCGSVTPEPCIPQKTTGQIYPLAVGNWWVFEHKVFKDQFGSVKYIDYDTITIIRDTLIDGEKWYYHSWWGFFTNRNDGLWGKHYYDSDSTTTQLDYKYPAKTNDTIIMIDDTSLKGVVLSADTSVSTPYGCYSAYCYTTIGLSTTHWKFVMFMVPGIGMVKRERWNSDGNDHWGRIEQWELISAELKK